jgi:P2 family phage contractile tail tube protein
MANDIITLEAANLFCGDHDPSAENSNHLTIQNLKLPGLEENNSDHTAGGAPIGIEIDTHVVKLAATFNLIGWNPQVIKLLGESRRERQIFTAYGVLRSRRSGKALELKAIMQGRMSKSNPTEFSRGNNQGHEHAINSIVHYEVYQDGDELLFWDFFTSTRRVGGVDLNADINRILRIPSAGGVIGASFTVTPDQPAGA